MVRRFVIIACMLLMTTSVRSTGHAAAQPAYARSSSSYPPDLSDVACPSTRVCYTVGYSGVQYNGRILCLHGWWTSLASTAARHEVGATGHHLHQHHNLL